MSNKNREARVWTQTQFRVKPTHQDHTQKKAQIPSYPQGGMKSPQTSHVWAPGGTWGCPDVQIQRILMGGARAASEVLGPEHLRTSTLCPPVLQRRHRNGKQVQEKALSIINNRGNAKEITIRYHVSTCLDTLAVIPSNVKIELPCGPRCWRYLYSSVHCSNWYLRSAKVFINEWTHKEMGYIYTQRLPLSHRNETFPFATKYEWSRGQYALWHKPCTEGDICDRTDVESTYNRQHGISLHVLMDT